MDKLKEYLLLHKAGLDVDTPASESWDTIGSKIPARSRIPLWIGKYAAALIVLAGTSLWLIVGEHKAPRETAKQDRGAVIPADSSKYDSGALAKERGTGTMKMEDSGRKAALVPDEDAAEAIDRIDKSYSSLIDYQLKKLRTTPLYAENGSYFSFYVNQFKQMDRDEQEVRDAIKTYGLTNEFLEQLINVYQQKLNLLKNLQTEINKMNNKVREKQSPLEKPEVHYLNI
jgi:hypothetical protein